MFCASTQNGHHDKAPMVFTPGSNYTYEAQLGDSAMQAITNTDPTWLPDDVACHRINRDEARLSEDKIEKLQQTYGYFTTPSDETLFL